MGDAPLVPQRSRRLLVLGSAVVMISFVLACTALALDVHLSNMVPLTEKLDDTFGKMKLPSEMKESDWVHFGDKIRFKLLGEDNMYLHADSNGWLLLKPGNAGKAVIFEALSIFPSNPGAHGRLSLGQKFYLKATGTNSFVHLGDAGDVRQGDNFFVNGLMDKTKFHMIDWPIAMEAQWGDKVKLSTPRGQLLQCKQHRACVDVEHARGGLHFVLENASPTASTQKKAAIKTKATVPKKK